MFRTIDGTFRAALVTGALTALSVTFLTALAETDTVRDGSGGGVRVRPAVVPAPVWPQSGAVRVIDTRRPPAGALVVQPSPAAKRDRGAA